MTQALKREVSLAQTIGFTITILIAVIGAWVSVNVKIADINARTANVEKENAILRQTLESKADNALFFQYMNSTNLKLDNIDKKMDKIIFMRVK